MYALADKTAFSTRFPHSLLFGDSRKYKKYLHDPDNHDGVITHLEPDILNVKSSGSQEALVHTKLVEVMGLQLSYFNS